VIDGAKIDLDKTDALCIHTLPSILHYALVLREGASSVKLGLKERRQSIHSMCRTMEALYRRWDTDIRVFIGRTVKPNAQTYSIA
jgi:hypothetical protein